MILYAFTANAELLPKNVWLQSAPLYEGGDPHWTACTPTSGLWSYPNKIKGAEPFVHQNVPCQCLLGFYEVPIKYVEDGEMWIDLDNHFAVDIYGPSTAANLRLFLAEHGIKITLNRLLTILAMEGKELLKYIAKWNKIAAEHPLKNESLWKAFSAATPQEAPPPAATLYDSLINKKFKITPKLSPYKWVLSKGVVVRQDTDKAADDKLEAELSSNVSF